MKLGLRRRSVLAGADASALLVWSADAAVWFAELAAQRAPAAGVRVGLVAASRAERRPVAALLLLPAPASLAPSPRATPCLQRGPGLVHPADAVLFPPLRDAEVKALVSDGVLFLHPTLGCTHFAPDDLHELARFVEAPPEGAALDHARPAATLAPRLLSVSAKPEHDPIQSLVAAGEEIGSQPLSGWRGWLSRWFRPRLLRPRERLDEALLRLLRDDPERGLRHALPLAGDAPPSGEPNWLQRLLAWLFGGGLPTREPDFDLDRLRGSTKRVRGRNLVSSRYHDLERTYRELAAAEARAGRHRRAAYIYAHLLRDLAAAAAVLEQGACWREAAHLYEHALGDPLHAATCLVKGEELARALAIYRRFDCHVEAGDTLRALGDAAAAEAAYERAVAACRQHGDHLGAAQLLDERLAQPDAALAELALACDGGANEALARRHTLAILTRLQRRDALCASLRSTVRAGLEALAAVAGGSRVRALAAEDAAGLRAQILLDFALASDEPTARELAKDGVRQLVAAAPDLAFAKDARLSAPSLRGLEPDDELHAADLTRLAQRRATGRRWLDDFGTGTRPAAAGVRRVAVSHALVRLLGCAANDAGMLVTATGTVRHGKPSVLLHWVPLLGARAATTQTFDLNGHHTHLVLAGPPGSSVFHLVERDARERRVVVDAGRTSRPVERPWPRGSVAVARRPDGHTFLLRTDPNAQDAWTLWRCDADLRLQATRRLPRLAPDRGNAPRLAAAAGWLAVADGRQLSLLSDAGLVLSAVLPWPVVWLAIAPWDCAAGRLMLAGARGQHVVLGAGTDGLRVLGFCERRIDAEPAFIAGDRFLLQASGALILARLAGEGIAAAPLAAGRIKMVCPTPRPGLVGIVDQNGLAWLEVD